MIGFSKRIIINFKGEKGEMDEIPNFKFKK